MPAKNLSLTVTVHQPDERLAAMIEANLPALTARYAALTANCSWETHPTILDLLRSSGAVVQVNQEQAGGIQTIGQVRCETIRAGLAAGTPHMQMCDFDRAIHWVATYPDELDAVIAEIPQYDFLFWDAQSVPGPRTLPTRSRRSRCSTGCLRW